MEKTIDKELISHLLRLEKDQQDRVLNYIKEMIANAEMNSRAEASEEDIASGNVKSFDTFDSNFENWKIQKKSSMK